MMNHEVEIWGVLNVTQDSFSDGGEYLQLEKALQHAHEMCAAGAHVVDIGGESSRPQSAAYGKGFITIDPEVELSRVLPLIKRLSSITKISVDTRKHQVASAAIQAGAHIINDVSMGKDPELLRAVANSDAELVLMHTRGDGARSMENTAYKNLLDSVTDELRTARDKATSLGIPKERIWLDPGIGFAKTASQSIALTARLDEIASLGHRVLYGASRKSFIAELASNPDGSSPHPLRRQDGTNASNAIAIFQGASAIRVHNVEAARQCAMIAKAAQNARTSLE